VGPREELFYRSENIYLSAANVPPALAAVFSPASRRELRQSLEEHFRHEFAPTLQVTANKYLPGQGTLIHTDFVPRHLGRDRFFFTHRFLAYFLRTWASGCGGALGLFASTNQASLAKTIEPSHNAGVGLVIGPRSYHAVASVKEGARYTLNFCLRSATGEYETGPPPSWPQP
jgi:Rps23 Pro-64 3,4-dihydroxylase Tpa1-like proline 4-hydroxylase